MRPAPEKKRRRRGAEEGTTDGLPDPEAKRGRGERRKEVGEVIRGAGDAEAPAKRAVRERRRSLGARGLRNLRNHLGTRDPFQLGAHGNQVFPLRIVVEEAGGVKFPTATTLGGPTGKTKGL